MKMMSKFISFFLLILCCASTVKAFDGSTITASGLQKFYIQGSDVKVANNGIFVNFEGDILNVAAVFVDDAGAYIAGLGSCRYCGKPNDDLGQCQNPRCKNYGKG
jgi:hypothetical protein